MRKSDLIIAAVILVIAGALLGINKYKSNIAKENSSKIYAEIRVSGKVYKTVPLDDGKEQEVVVDTELGKNIIKFHDHGVEIIDADCFDKVCVRTGFKKEIGETIVCLPHQLVIEIKGSMEGKVDAVSN